MELISIDSLILIVFLVFPGIIFKRFFYQDELSKQYGSGLFADRIITTIFWGLLIALFNIYLFSITHEDQILLKFQAFFRAFDDKSFAKANTFIMPIATFTIVSLLLSVALGHFLYTLMKWTRVDKVFPALRFSCKWAYLFEPKKRSIKVAYKNRRYRLNFLSTRLDVLINAETGVPGKYKLVKGILKDYSTDSKGQLEYICLSDIEIFKPQEEHKKFVPIESHLFIVDYRNIIDMNIRHDYESSEMSDDRSLFFSVYPFVALLFLLSIFIAPWFAKVTIWRQVFSVFLMFLSWLFFIAGIEMFRNKRATWLSSIFLFGFSFMILEIALNLLNIAFVRAFVMYCLCKIPNFHWYI